MWLVDNDGVIKFVHVTRVTVDMCFYYGMNSAGINGHSPPITLGPLEEKQRAVACTRARANPVKPKHTYREEFCAHLQA